MIKNHKQWKKTLHKATNGNAEAQWWIGYYYSEGLFDCTDDFSVDVNLKKAAYWYELSAKQGHVGAQLNLSALYCDKDFNNGTKKAIFWAKQAIKQRSASACNNLGCLYRDLNKPKKSFKCYKQAVNMGDGDALLSVGLCYLFGYGVKHSHKKAKKYLQKTVKQQKHTSVRTTENAMYWLSVMSLLNINKTNSDNLPSNKFNKARKQLMRVNADNDYEQIHDILNIIGRN